MLTINLPHELDKDMWLIQGIGCGDVCGLRDSSDEWVHIVGGLFRIDTYPDLAIFVSALTVQQMNGMDSVLATLGTSPVSMRCPA